MTHKLRLTREANEKRDRKMRKVKSANAVIGATAIGIPFSLQQGSTDQNRSVRSKKLILKFVNRTRTNQIVIISDYYPGLVREFYNLIGPRPVRGSLLYRVSQSFQNLQNKDTINLQSD